MIPLRQVQIPTPCPRSWDSMAGGPQTRFCDGCGKHVHNLSEMSRREGEDLLTRTGGQVCVYFYPDANGTPLPREEVPAHLALASRPHPHGRQRAWAVALSGLLALALSALGSVQAAVTKRHPTGKSAAKSPDRKPAKASNTAPTAQQRLFGGEIAPAPRTLGGKPVLPPSARPSAPITPLLGGVPAIPLPKNR